MRHAFLRLFLLALLLPLPLAAQAPAAEGCVEASAPNRNPSARELRCRYGIHGPGRFGLTYVDVPVYQPATPLPGNHVVGVPGMPGPRRGESFEAWEWRVLRTDFRAAGAIVRRGLDVLDPIFASRLIRFERLLAERGVRARRRETWRSPERQAHLFQQGRSRPGPIATSTLTSWHSRIDERGMPAARAVDYDVPGSQMRLFHQVVEEAHLESYGADSNDPGHVFLPGGESFEGDAVALLRTLPRVPVVTLATGRPVHERHTATSLQELREAVRRVLAHPIAPPRLDVSAPAAPPQLLLRPSADAGGV